MAGVAEKAIRIVVKTKDKQNGTCHWEESGFGGGRGHAGGYNSGMTLEFRRAVVPEEAAELWKLDVQIFGDDAFAEELWLSLESYWIVVDGRVAGCAAFIHDVEFQEDLRTDRENAAQRGTLYIQSTGLLRAYQGQGLGKRIKEWQIEYARRNGFHRIVTNCRESNARMISINEKCGFRAIRSTPGYYEDGEATVVTELVLP